MSTAELLPAVERRIVIIDGYEVDDDTGEVLGLAEAPIHPTLFRVDGPDAADWVLSKVAEADSEIVGLEALKAALVANVDRKIKVQQARRDYLLFRFGPELEALAREQLAGGKRKTYQLPHGSIAFRTSKGTNTITDMEAAVSWMHQHGHSDKVRITESVKIPDLLAVATDPAELPFLESSGPRETVTIKTGVGD